MLLDVPKALREFNRVLRVGGRLWLSLHRWKDIRFILQGTWDANPAKTLAFGVYAATNGALFHYTGKVVYYPLNRSRMMSFHTETRMRRELQKAGFGDITFSHGTFFVVESEKFRSVSTRVFSTGGRTLEYSKRKAS